MEQIKKFLHGKGFALLLTASLLAAAAAGVWAVRALRAELQKLSDWTKTTREWGKKEAFHACSAALAKKNGAAFEAHREQSRPSAMCAVN